jgi:hypothetical protein
MLVGCLTVLGIVLVILIIATIFVMRSYRGWIATGIEKSVDAALVEMQLDDAEQGEVMAHVNTLMTRYKDKEIGLEDLGGVLASIAESPLIGVAIIGVMDAVYFSESGLSEEEQAEGRLQLGRYAQGLREQTIDLDTLETVLDSVSTTTPDSDDIQINIPDALNISLRSSDEVSDDDLRAVIEQAKAQADEAGIAEVPEEIDISDTLGIAIADALGEDPGEWVTGYVLPAPEVETEPVDDGAPDDAGNEDPVEDDGP